MKTSKELSLQLRNTITVEGILHNELCYICGKRVTDKCLQCLLESRISGMCYNHHFEKFHKPVWISALE